MIYLNHAATSYPRLPEVKEAVLNCMDRLPSSEYRSNAAGDVSLAPACREKLGRLFHIKETCCWLPTTVSVYLIRKPENVPSS